MKRNKKSLAKSAYMPNGLTEGSTQHRLDGATLRKIDTLVSHGESRSAMREDSSVSSANA